MPTGTEIIILDELAVRPGISLDQLKEDLANEVTRPGLIAPTARGLVDKGLIRVTDRGEWFTTARGRTLLRGEAGEI
ncbi:hypothetical protein LCGC14_0864770 [marine sediment metagenome]|uniref:ArnR1-like winged helix-turn-helix domain-containing protein n=1 Tax=marine sediment metagenome TaxID=412755 RepID=A0A0F9P6D4_9ZZZZ